ncbi:MAG TPA: phytoene/squalene synthase family protein [Roseiarcus sp.]|jgi:phytoene synthase
MSEAGERAEPMRRAYEHCGELVREAARERWLSALFAPEDARPHLHAVAAFDIETARVSGLVREPLAGEMRLAWWREALIGERAGEAAAHPVTAALLDTIDRFALPRQAFDDLLHARSFDLYDDDMPTLAALETYCHQIDGALFQMAALILGKGGDLGADEASEAAGVAVGLTRVLRAFPRASGRGPAYAPRDLLEGNGVSGEDLRERRGSPGMSAVFSQLRERALHHLAEAERRIATLPPIVAPAFVPLGAARLDLKRLERASAAPFAPLAEPAAWRRQLALWLWARGRRG